VSVEIGMSVGGVVLVGIGVLVDAGAAAVQAAKVLATAVSTAPGGGVDGVDAQAAKRKATIRRTSSFFICSPFPAPLDGMVTAYWWLINTIQDFETKIKEEIFAFLQIATPTPSSG
jgi:hypothetical protein